MPLVITDSGCYGYGFPWRLPSGGWGWFELAVWYAGTHVAEALYLPQRASLAGS